MSDPSPRIRIYSHFEGTRSLVIRDSVNITFYMRRPHSELMHAVDRAIETFRRAMGPQALPDYMNSEGYPEDLDEAGWAFIKQNLLDPRGAILYLGDRRDLSSACEVVYKGRPFDSPDYYPSGAEVSALCFWLPTEYLE
jgi:hypothetical protein